MATGGSSSQVAETIQGGAAVQQPDSVKETGSEHKEPDKGMPSGIAEQTEMNEKREEELKQLYKRESEKMELYFKKLEKLEQDINEYKTGLTTKMSDSNDVSPPTMAETSQGGAAGQHQDSVKEMGAENEEPDKRMPSGIAEQTEMYEKRVEAVKQPHQTESEKMEPDLREEVRKLKQELNYSKTGGTTKRSDSKEPSPTTMVETTQGGAAGKHQDSDKRMGAENEEPDNRMPSGIAEQTEMHEQRVEAVKQPHQTELEKMEPELRKEVRELKQEINDYKTGGTTKRSDSKESSPTTNDQRVVLLGKIGAGKSSLANRILGREIFKTEEIGLCRRKQGEHAGRKLTVVDTPGWDRVSVLRTPERIKQEIIRSATLCLPGPHALLLVLPISMHDQPPSANEIKSASHHVALLSHRAWRHTIVLFVCKDEMDTSTIDQHVQRAKKLINNCEGRYFILHNDSDVTALLQKIEDMVEENHGDFLIPQVSYEESDKRMQSGSAEQTEMHEKRVEELKQQYRRECEKMELDFKEQLEQQEQEINDYKTGGTMKRSDSKEFLPPTMDETSQDGAAVQHPDSLKGMGAENEESEKRMHSAIAEQIEIHKKGEEELEQQYKRKCEKMELGLREEVRKLKQEINDYKTGGTTKRSDSTESSPPTMAGTSQGRATVQHQDSVKEMVAENKEPEKGKPSGTAEQTETYEKREEELKQHYRRECEKMELDFREQLWKLEQEIDDHKTGRTKKRRDSKEFLPPAMDEATQGGAAVQHLAVNELFVIIMMAFFGALGGSILGATDGVKGSVVGVLFGNTIGVLLAILYIRLTRFVLGSGRVSFVIERGEQNSVRSDSSSKSTEKPKKQ